MKNNFFKFFAIVILSITFSILYSCSTPFNTIKKNTIIGTNRLTNSKIIANEFVFPENVYDFYIDTTKMNITVQVRGFNQKHHPNVIGELYQYDMSLQNLKWNKSFNFKYYKLIQRDSFILRIHDRKLNYINSEDGEIKWSVSNDLFHIINANLIGYDNSKWYRKKQLISGIDLNNGKTIWKRDINLINKSQYAVRLNDTVTMLVADGLHTYNLKNGKGWDRFIFMSYGYNDILKLNDFTNLVVADGLHSVNLNTGTGWGFKRITGTRKLIKRNNTLTIFEVGLGLIQENDIYSPLTSGLVEDDFIYRAKHYIICDIVSNVIIDNSKIYWASKQNIVKLDTSGKVQWENNLPNDEVSKSKIFINGRVLCLLNLGYAFSTTFLCQNIIYGKPFIEGFDKNTGNKLYYQSLKNNNYPITGYKVSNNTLILFSDSIISKYSIDNGELIKEKAINTDTLGLIDCYISNSTYILKDSLLICLNDSNSTYHCILTKNKKIIQINDQLEVLNIWNNEDTYAKYLAKGDFNFIGNAKDSYILDTNNNVIANLKASNKAVLIGSKLYDKQEKTMIIIDLKDLIKV